jgi:hypothetical protein
MPTATKSSPKPAAAKPAAKARNGTTPRTATPAKPGALARDMTTSAYSWLRRTLGSRYDELATQLAGAKPELAAAMQRTLDRHAGKGS